MRSTTLRSPRSSPRQSSPRPSRDHGTPELIRKRANLTGNADPALSEHPLAVLHARGYLHPDSNQSAKMYHAALAFGALWGRVFRPPYAQSQLSQYQASGQGGNFTEEALIHANAILRLVREKLKERQLYDNLVNCVIYRRAPHKDLALEKLRTALCRLVEMDLSLEQSP